ncbi:MAG: redoxin domain-containing protein [Armatimonadota bacterium]|nr:redoxin domain-containing protein [Armatimonadota bacterium]
MKTVVHPKIQNHALVPQFDLPATRGKRARIWSYKGHQNLVIFFVTGVKDAEARTFLKDLASRYDDYLEHNCEILVVSQDNIETLESVASELGLPFPLVSDVDGSVTERYTESVPAVFVVDRYGELYAQSEVDRVSDLADHERILAGLHLIEMECPECGVTTWTL